MKNDRYHVDDHWELAMARDVPVFAMSLPGRALTPPEEGAHAGRPTFGGLSRITRAPRRPRELALLAALLTGGLAAAQDPEPFPGEKMGQCADQNIMESVLEAAEKMLDCGSASDDQSLIDCAIALISGEQKIRIDATGSCSGVVGGGARTLPDCQTEVVGPSGNTLYVFNYKPGGTNDILICHKAFDDAGKWRDPDGNGCQVLAGVLAHERCHARTGEWESVNSTVEPACPWWCNEVKCSCVEIDLLDCLELMTGADLSSRRDIMTAYKESFEDYIAASSACDCEDQDG